MIINIFYASLIIAILLKIYFQKVYDYWKSRHVPTPEYSYIVGNLGSSFDLKMSIGELYTETYNNFKGYNYVGFYKFMQPSILIRNPDIINDILVKNFDSFQDNDVYVDESVDILFGKNLFAKKGNNWKLARNKISPHFSSSKIEELMPLIVENAKQLINHLEGKKSEFQLEVKELFSKFTCDNIASCVFGLNGCCLSDGDDEFYECAMKLILPSRFNNFKILIGEMFPFLSSKLKIKFVSNNLKDYFKNIIKETTEYRKANKINRNDVLDWMSPLIGQQSNKEGLTYDELTALAVSFLLDGFETNAIVISFALYEIACNPSLQEKLRKEIDDVVEKHDDEFTYEALENMTFLDCVFKENLRKNPPVLSISRCCTKPFELPPALENGLGATPILEPGISVVIPIDALHMDEKLFPEPTEFIPDRFSKKIKETVKKGSYLPFGGGPRMCLGKQFGILQSKIGIAAIVSNYDISVYSKTKEPIELDPKHFLRTPVGGIWLKFSRRK